MSVIPCRFCLNSFSDPSGELERHNDFSSLSVGTVFPDYRMSIDTGGSRSTALVVCHYNKELGLNEDVCIYKMKYCPNCGRRLFENDLYERYSPPAVPEGLTK